MLKKHLTKSKNINAFSKKYINYLYNVFNSLEFQKLDKLEKELLKLRARNSTLFEFSTQWAIAVKFASDRSISDFRPPILIAQFSPSKASSTQSMEGVLIVAALNTDSFNLPPEVRRKIFGKGHAGV